MDTPTALSLSYDPRIPPLIITSHSPPSESDSSLTEKSLLDSISPPTGTSIDEGILLASTLSLAHSLARLRYLEVPLDNLTNYAALLVLLPAAVGVVFGARTLYGGPGESGEGKKWGARGLTFGHTAVLGTGGWMMRESPVLVLVPFSFLLAFYQYKTLQSGSIRLKLT